MKNAVKNCVATTGLALLLLAVIAACYGAKFIFVVTVLQTGLASVAVHAGLAVLERFQSRYFLVETAVRLGYIIAVLLLFGYWFHWYSSTPPWLLAVMGVVVYVIGGLIDVIRVRSDVEEINHRLERRRELLREK